MKTNKLSADSHPSEKLLTIIAKQVIPKELRMIVADLGMDEPEFSRIQRDYHDNILEQTFQVKKSNTDKNTKLNLMKQLILSHLSIMGLRQMSFSENH